MVSAGQYVLAAALLAALIGSLGFSAYRLRQKLLPAWEGTPARLVEAVVGVALLIWLAELLGIASLLYAGTLVASALVLAGATAWWTRGKNASPAGGVGVGGSPPPVGSGGRGHKAASEESRCPEEREGQGGPPTPTTGPAGQALMSLIALAVVAVTFAHWGLTAKDALGRGIFNFDSLWYHLPFATDIAQTHSVTAFFHPETVFVNWFYPQNSELLHATGILLTGRDTLSLFINFGWLALAFLAAWCIGRPYGRGPLCVVAVAIVLESHTLVVREPGAAKDDLMAASLLLASIAILVNAWAQNRRAPDVPPLRAIYGHSSDGTLGWALAAAGLAAGLAVGTKSTAVAMAAALTVAIVFLAPAGRRWAAFGWWFLPALAGGGYWYMRNLIASGNPLPQLEHLGPVSLPHPERLQDGRPDFSVVHYATDTGVWREYFAPGLHQAFGGLWPLVLAGALAAALLALLWGRTRLLRWLGGVVLFGLLAYLFTPLSAAGAEGEPVGFAINIRYAIPALLAGLALLPLTLPSPSDVPRVEHHYGRRIRGTSRLGWVLMGGLVLVWLATDRPDAVLHDPDRLFALLVALLAVLVPAGLLLARRRGASIALVAGGFAALALAAVAIGYPVQRDYLRHRYLNADPETAIPGMHLDSAYRWARGVHGARIGLAGTTAGFLGYGFYGTDLSNRVRYLGEPGPHGAFNAIPTCSAFRAAVNDADLDYLVTSPLLNFVHPGNPIPSPEAAWLRGDPPVTPVLRSGPVTVWKVDGRLDPAACDPRNAPLRRIPQQPPG